ncbi:MAG: polysaccharide deacetylase family protein [Silicimonas sp.]|nr:polysaccharide deacetylase family protein [Silicimonas sp.]
MSIAAGMDHDLYPYRGVPGRAAIEWPGGAKVAFAPVVYLEHWPYEATPGGYADPRFRDPYGAFQPDYRGHTWREYGNRIGIFRLFEVLDRFGLTATLAANASAAKRYPVIIDEALRRGWEIAAHGDVADAMVTSEMSADQEADLIALCLASLEGDTGARPKGWIAQDFGESTRSVDLLAKAGIEWIAHWPNDDQPYWMASAPPIVSVPQLSELDDAECLWHRRVPTPRWPGMLEEAISVMAGESGRVAVIGIHPWIFGMPHRIRYLGEGLRRVAEIDGVWSTCVGQIAAHYRSKQAAEGAL